MFWCCCVAWFLAVAGKGNHMLQNESRATWRWTWTPPRVRPAGEAPQLSHRVSYPCLRATKQQFLSGYHNNHGRCCTTCYRLFTRAV